MVQLVEGPTLDPAADGVLAGLKEAGLRDGADFELKKHNAQGDMAQLPLILAHVKSQRVDLIITSTTPAMIAAARATRDIPIVFTVASYPPTVGVFPEGQRQNNLVGVYDDPPLRELMELAQKREGAFKKVGIVWNPAEPNSEHSVKKLRRVCSDKGLELIERHAAAVTELPDAAAAVCQAGAQVFVISADNVTSSGFPAILSVTRKHRVPLYSTEPDMVRRGAAGGVGDDFYEWGKQTGRMAAKVLAGVSPGDLPFEKTAVQRTLVSEDAPPGR
jgi:putative ABC transport system substrate-binding protein